MLYACPGNDDHGQGSDMCHLCHTLPCIVQVYMDPVYTSSPLGEGKPDFQCYVAEH